MPSVHERPHSAVWWPARLLADRRVPRSRSHDDLDGAPVGVVDLEVVDAARRDWLVVHERVERGRDDARHHAVLLIAALQAGVEAGHVPNPELSRAIRREDEVRAVLVRTDSVNVVTSVAGQARTVVRDLVAEDFHQSFIPGEDLHDEALLRTLPRDITRDRRSPARHRCHACEGGRGDQRGHSKQLLHGASLGIVRTRFRRGPG